MLQPIGDLEKVFPDSLFRDEFVEGFEMFNHFAQVSGIGEFENDEKFFVFNEWTVVADYVGMMKGLQFAVEC